MGFRTGAFCKVWEVKPLSDTNTKLRISISRKNKATGEYEQDFSGFVNAIGTATAKKAAALNEGDRIKLGDVDVSTRYVKDENRSYTNYKIFTFELDSGASDSGDVDDGVDGGEDTETTGKKSGKKLPF